MWSARGLRRRGNDANKSCPARCALACLLGGSLSVACVNHDFESLVGGRGGAGAPGSGGTATGGFGAAPNGTGGTPGSGGASDAASLIHRFSSAEEASAFGVQALDGHPEPQAEWSSEYGGSLRVSASGGLVFRALTRLDLRGSELRARVAPGPDTTLPQVSLFTQTGDAFAWLDSGGRTPEAEGVELVLDPNDSGAAPEGFEVTDVRRYGLKLETSGEAGSVFLDDLWVAPKAFRYGSASALETWAVQPVGSAQVTWEEGGTDSEAPGVVVVRNALDSSFGIRPNGSFNGLGLVLRAVVQVDGSGESTCWVYVKDGQDHWVDSGAVRVGADWTTVALDIARPVTDPLPVGYDPKDIRELGIKVTGNVRLDTLAFDVNPD
jgi:hypothetical protein